MKKKKDHAEHGPGVVESLTLKIHIPTINQTRLLTTVTYRNPPFFLKKLQHSQLLLCYH